MGEGLQSDQEIAAVLGAGSPASSVQAWAVALAEGDFDACWGALTAVLQRRLVTDWALANEHHPWMQGRDLGVLVDGLLSDREPASAWSVFTVTVFPQLRVFREILDGGWVVASRPRPVTVNVEAVVVVQVPAGFDAEFEATSQDMPDEQIAVLGYPFLVERVADSWLICGLPGMNSKPYGSDFTTE